MAIELLFQQFLKNREAICNRPAHRNEIEQFRKLLDRHTEEQRREIIETSLKYEWKDLYAFDVLKRHCYTEPSATR